jgi:carbohydrate kinase (thermoresistant glucokinase family)
MGVQGAGKSTIGALIAERLELVFVDGDRLHSEENVARMAAGIALTDDERLPWLRDIARVLSDGRDRGIVVVCSALKREYRDLLRESVPDLFVVDPEGPMDLVAARISEREHEYMPPELLQSQYDILEPLAADERGVIVDIGWSPEEITDRAVEAIQAELEAGVSHGHQQG